jgi:hypothetical protein
MADSRYELRVTGRISERVQDAFADVDVDDLAVDTVISGLVRHDDQLHALLAAAQELGLHIASVQQVAP